MSFPDNFQHVIMEYHRIGDQKEVLGKQNRDLGKRYKDLESEIMSALQERNVEAVEFDGVNVSLEVKKRAATLNRDLIVQIGKMHPIFKERPDTDIANFAEFLFKNRPQVETVSVRKTVVG